MKHRPVVPDEHSALALEALRAAIGALLAARLLIPETLDRLDLLLLDAQTRALGPSPGGSAMLDVLLLALATVTFAVGRATISGLWVGAIALFGGGALTSALLASDSPGALRGGLNLVATVVAAAAIAAYPIIPGLRATLLAALLAGGGTVAIKCVLHPIELGWTLELWRTQHLPELLKSGTDPSAPEIVNFERRMRSGEAMGFQSHPNVAGGCLAMTLIAGCGALALLARSAGDRLQRGLLWSAAAIGTVLHVVAIYYTGSLGAALAIAAALVAIAELAWFRPALRSAAAVAVVGYLLAGCALLVMGWTDTWPHESLRFRWEYWRAGWVGWLERPLTGVGRLNFGDVFLRHKSPAATEEVRDAHSLWVSLVVETGLLGLVGGLGLALASGLRLLRACHRAPFPGVGSGARSDADGRNVSKQGAPAARAADEPVARPPIGLVAFVLAVVLATAALLRGATFDPLLVALPWTTIFVAALLLLTSGLAARRLAAATALAGVGALAAALVHALIDFPLLTPAGLACLALIIALGGHCPMPPRPASPRAGLILAAASAVLALAGFVAVARPALRADRVFAEYDAAFERAIGAQGSGAAVAALVDPQAISPILEQADRDAGLLRSVARRVLAVARSAGAPQALRQRAALSAQMLAERAVALTPNSAATRRLWADSVTLQAVLASKRVDNKELMDVLAAWRAAIAADPTNPRLYIAAADGVSQLQFQNQQPAAAFIRECVTTALAVDEQRPAASPIRLTPHELELAQRLRDAVP